MTAAKTALRYGQRLPTQLEKRILIRQGSAARRDDNLVDTGPVEYYAFVSEFEGEPDGLLWIELECVSKVWMDSLWDELRKLFDQDALLAYFFARINGQRFEDLYPTLNAAERFLFYVVYRWFLMRVLDDGRDPAPVATFGFALDPGDPLRDELYEQQWCYLALKDSPRTNRPDDTFVENHEIKRVGVLERLGFTPDDDLPPVDRWILSIGGVPFESKGAITQTVLHLLHFPVTSADLPGDIDEETPPDSPPGSPYTPPTDSPMGYKIPDPVREPILARQAGAALTGLTRWLRRALADALAALARGAATAREWLDDLVPPGGGALAYAGAPAGALPARSVRPSPRAPSSAGPRALADAAPSVLSYVGGGGAANPMDSSAPGARPTFAGVLNIGQGGCNAIYDAQGHAIAYFDFGSPSNGQTGTMPFEDHLGASQGHYANPCLCNAPLIILSHWDMDHIELGRYYTESFRCTWLASQQHMGTVVCRETIARVVHDGGKFFIWTASGAPGANGTPGSNNDPCGSHMRLPWGFLERCYRPGQNALQAGSDQRNNSGLALHLCVKDAAGAMAVGGGVVATNANNTGNPGCDAVGILGAPPWLAAGWAGPALPAIGTAATLRTILQNVDADGLAARAEEVAIHAVIGGGNPGAAFAGPLRLIAAAVALAHPGTPAAAVARLTFVMHRAAAVVTAGGGALRRVVEAATSALLVENHQANTHQDVFTAIGNAALAVGAVAVGGNVAVGDANLGDTALNAMRLAVNGAPAANPIETLAGDGNITAIAGAALTRAVGYAMALSVAPPLVPRVAGLDVCAHVAQALGVPAITLAHAFAAALPPTLEGAAPFHANERYVLLTGDVNYEFVPAQKHPFAGLGGNPAAPPVVVGISATHHGSNRIGAGLLNGAFIPWAPGSTEARDGRAAHAAAQLPTTRDQAVLCAVVGRASPLAVPAEVARLVAAADTALDAAVAQAGGWNLEAACRGAAAAILAEAAAIAAPAAALGGPIWTAIGTVAAGGASAAALPYAGFTGGAIGAINNPTELANATAHVVGGVGGAAIVRAVVAAGAQRHQPAFADECTSARRTVARLYVANSPAAPQPVLATLGACTAARLAVLGGGALGLNQARAVATAVDTGFQAGPLVGASSAAVLGAAIANLPGNGDVVTEAAVIAAPNPPRAAAIAAVVAGGARPPVPEGTTPQVVAAALGLSPAIVLDALIAGESALAADEMPSILGMLAVLPNTTADQARSMLDAADAAQIDPGRVAGAAAAAGMALASNSISYSYGLRENMGNYEHRYGSPGHPHDVAIAKYRARGWTGRRNTALHAHESLQPDASPSGPHLLGWEVGGLYEGPIRPIAAPPAPQSVIRVCEGCARRARTKAGAAAGGGANGPTSAAIGAGIVTAVAAAAAPPQAVIDAAAAAFLAEESAAAAQRGVIASVAAVRGLESGRAAFQGWGAAMAAKNATAVATVAIAQRAVMAPARAALEIALGLQNVIDVAPQVIPGVIAAAAALTYINNNVSQAVEENAVVHVAGMGSRPYFRNAIGPPNYMNAELAAMLACALNAMAFLNTDAPREAALIAASLVAAGVPAVNAAAAATYARNGQGAIATIAAQQTAQALAGAAPNEAAGFGVAVAIMGALYNQAMPAGRRVAAAGLLVNVFNFGQVDNALVAVGALGISALYPPFPHGANPHTAASAVGLNVAIAPGTALDSALVAAALAGAGHGGPASDAVAQHFSGNASAAGNFCATLILNAQAAMPSVCFAVACTAVNLPGGYSLANNATSAAAAAAVAIPVGTVGNAAVDTIATTIDGGAVACAANARAAQAAMNATDDAAAAVAASRAVLGTAAYLPGNAAHANACWAAGARGAGVAAAAADAAANALPNGATATAAVALNPPWALHVTGEAAAAIIGAATVSTALGNIPADAVDAATCWAAAAGAAGVLAQAADAAAVQLTAGAFPAAVAAATAAGTLNARGDTSALVAGARAVVRGRNLAPLRTADAGVVWAAIGGALNADAASTDVAAAALENGAPALVAAAAAGAAGAMNSSALAGAAATAAAGAAHAIRPATQAHRGACWAACAAAAGVPIAAAAAAAAHLDAGGLANNAATDANAAIVAGASAEAAAVVGAARRVVAAAAGGAGFAGAANDPALTAGTCGIAGALGVDPAQGYAASDAIAANHPQGATASYEAREIRGVGGTVVAAAAVAAARAVGPWYAIAQAAVLAGVNFQDAAAAAGCIHAFNI